MIRTINIFTDKELYAWMKCVKGQPHDHKHLMPTQIIPGSGKITRNIKHKIYFVFFCVCKTIEVWLIVTLTFVSIIFGIVNLFDIDIW